MKGQKVVFLVSGIAVLAGLVFTSTPVVATTFPGKNGVIAFVKDGHDSAKVWTLHPERGNVEQILKHAQSPAWSPDGKHLAFIGNDQHLWLANADGNEQRKLTEGKKVSDSSPVWSSDGSKIAFVREQKQGAKLSAIMIVDANGRKEMNISGWAQFRSPSWSPNSKEVVYEQYGIDESKLLISHLPSRSVRTLVTLSENIESRVSWSPTGNKILYSDSLSEVYTIWPDGSHRAVISDGESYQASWSPDGKRIAFLEDPGDDHISISEEDGTVNWISFDKGEYTKIGAPLWSPDGTMVVFPMSDGHGTDTFLLRVTTDDPLLRKIAHKELREANWQSKPLK